MTTRRQWLTSTALAACGSVIPHKLFASVVSSLPGQLERIEKESGGRLGVALLNPSTGRMDGYRLDERFPLCSTFKVLLAAAVLQRVEQGKEQLDRRIPILPADILSYAPVTQQHIGPDGMTLSELCSAAVILSDNTAANLLLSTLGGPGAVTTFARSLGDSVTRLDRTEPSLNTAIPGDPRDTTTPHAVAQDLSALVLGNVLSPRSRTLLKTWMLDCQTGAAQIRAGLPAGSLVADKTGSGQRNTSNDIAVLWPPDAPPHVLAVYLTISNLASPAARSAVIAKVARTCFPTQM